MENIKRIIYLIEATISRGWFALFSWSFMGIMTTVFVNLIFVGWPGIVISIPLSIAFTCFSALFTWDTFAVEVPAQTGRNLKHYFTGLLITYGPGLHIIYPWETKRGGKGIYPLTVVKEELTEDYPALDGPMLIAKLMFEYVPSLKNLVQFELVDTKAIREGLVDRASSFLLGHIKGENAEDIRQGIKTLQSEIEFIFGVDKNGVQNQSTLEDAYGIEIRKASLADLDYEPHFQVALTNAKIVAKIMEEADRIYIHHGGKINADKTCEDGSISRTVAFEKAMVIFEKATQTTIKGGKGVMMDMNSN